jgi:hypothetical protein
MGAIPLILTVLSALHGALCFLNIVGLSINPPNGVLRYYIPSAE